MSDLFVSMNSEDEIYDLAEIDSDVVIGNLLGDIKKLQAENADLQDKLEDDGFVLVMGRDDVEELEKLRKENAALKKQSQWNLTSESEFPKRNCFIVFKEFNDKSIYNGFLEWSPDFSYGSVVDDGEVIALGCIESFVELPTPPEGE